MERNIAIEFAQSQVMSQERHQDYDRSVLLAEEYMRLITGEEIEALLSRFIKREDEELFEQRVRITQAITPAVASSIMKPFYKVSRNDKVRKRHNFQNPEKDASINEMIQTFYGSRRKKTRGLEYWLKTRFVELTFHDPNAWVVTEWEKVEPNQIPTPHPFEVSSKEAVNFRYVNDDLKWLFVKNNIKFEVLKTDGAVSKEDGCKYTLYDEDYTVVVRQIDKKFYLSGGYELQENETIWEYEDKEYLITVYEPNLGFVAAFRVGYCRDGYTKGRIFVNPFHPALAFFRKSIKTVSELDLTMSLHTFPQKLQYVERCQGESKIKSCHGGYVNGTSEVCTSCKGSGYRIHTTAQDAILLPMPDDPMNSMKLDELLVYKAPPIDLIKFQDEYTKGLKLEAHMAVFNSTVFVNQDVMVAKTATEIDTNMESIYDTLEPYTEKISEIWKELIYVFAHLAAVDKPDAKENENVHQFPADLKLKTTAILLNELKLVNDSGAPSFMRDAVSNDLAEIIYNGDALGMIKHSIKHRFFPFNGKSPDEIAMLLSSEMVSKFTKVLYSNFEAIFTDIEKENPEFWVMESYSKQWNIVQDKTNEYMKELEVSEPVRIDFGSGRDPGLNPGEGEEPGDGNASNDGNES